jgi:hypothetical protein
MIQRMHDFPDLYFVATVEGTWEQVSGILIMAIASGDFNKAMVLEAIPE